MARQPFNPDLIQGAAPAARATPESPLTVSQITALIRTAIEATLPATVYVVGEISNYKRHSSGHVYFTLKDHACELACVLWRSAAAGLKFAPADGLAVVVTGQMTVFERGGRYQLMVRRIEPRGVGALELAFRQLCDKLAAEGLFDRSRKRSLPRFPKRIAIVTSPTGAAVADMLRTLERRFPALSILMYPVRVQGPGAAEDIAAAIRRINENRERLGGIDAMIVGRGGGSIEDLWAFNEEAVARAIHASAIPVVSAVGHETDVTVSDLVADVRAATPTAAAELVAPVLSEVIAGLDSLAARLARTLQHAVALSDSRLIGLSRRNAFRDPLLLIRLREQAIDDWCNRVHRSLGLRLQTMRRALDHREPVLQRIAPHAYLLRTSLRLRDADHRLKAAVVRRLTMQERVLSNQEKSLARTSPRGLVFVLRDRVARLAATLPTALAHRTTLLRLSAEGCEQRLLAMSHRSVLVRGFSITRAKKTGRIIRSTREVADRQRLLIEVRDGTFEAEAVNLVQKELFDGS